MYIRKDRLSPLLKYPGGKESELKYIHRYLPKKIDSYYEPFLGGASVYLSMDVKEYYVNDKSTELMNFYESIKTQDKEFLQKLDAINHNWKLITDITLHHADELSGLYLDFYKGEIQEQILSFFFQAEVGIRAA